MRSADLIPLSSACALLWGPWVSRFTLRDASPQTKSARREGIPKDSREEAAASSDSRAGEEGVGSRLRLRVGGMSWVTRAMEALALQHSSKPPFCNLFRQAAKRDGDVVPMNTFPSAPVPLAERLCFDDEHCLFSLMGP